MGVILSGHRMCLHKPKIQQCFLNIHTLPMSVLHLCMHKPLQCMYQVIVQKGTREFEELVYEPQPVYLMGSGPFPNIIPPKYAYTDRQLTLTDQIATACHRSFIIKLCPSSAFLSNETNWKGVRISWEFFPSQCLTAGWFADKWGRLCLDPTSLGRKGQNKPHTQVREFPLWGGALLLQ